MWISPAYAQDAGGGDLLTSMLPLVLIFVVFYFLLIRPQQKKAKEHRNMVDNVRRGDEVVTGGGIVGKVTKVKDDNHIQIEIAEGVRINVVKGTLSDVRTGRARDARHAVTLRRRHRCCQSRRSQSDFLQAILRWLPSDLRCRIEQSTNRFRMLLSGRFPDRRETVPL